MKQLGPQRYNLACFNLMKVVKRTYRLKNFFKKEIWEMELENLTKAKARFVKYCKVAIITIKTFSSQKIGFQAELL